MLFTKELKLIRHSLVVNLIGPEVRNTNPYKLGCKKIFYWNDLLHGFLNLIIFAWRNVHF